MSRNKFDSFKIKLRRFIYYLKHDVFVVENTALIAAVIICLVLTYNSINSMSRNWNLSEKLASDNKDLQLLQVEIETLELENDYYKTNEYQELSARKLANKQLPGEKLVYLPANSDYAKNKHAATVVTIEEPEASNFDKWMRFLFPSV